MKDNEWHEMDWNGTLYPELVTPIILGVTKMVPLSKVSPIEVGLPTHMEPLQLQLLSAEVSTNDRVVRVAPHIDSERPGRWRVCWGQWVRQKSETLSIFYSTNYRNYINIKLYQNYSKSRMEAAWLLVPQCWLIPSSDHTWLYTLVNLLAAVT